MLRRGVRGAVVSGPSNGVLLDVSLYGAGLYVEQIRIDSFHFFYAPQDNPAHVLHLEVQPSAEEEWEPLSIPVRPVRLDRFLDDEFAAKPFHLGVEFMLDPTDEQVRALHRLVVERSRRKGWWRKLFDSLLVVR